MKNNYLTDGDTTIIYYDHPTKGRFEILIDTEELENLLPISSTLTVVKKRHTYYAMFDHKEKGTRKHCPIYLHRLILGCFPGDKVYVDHRDGNGLNNKKNNFRKLTSTQNLQNTSVVYASSGFLNVHYCKQTGKWAVKVMANKKLLWGGRFDNIEDAKKKAIEMRIKYLPYSREAMINDAV